MNLAVIILTTIVAVTLLGHLVVHRFMNKETLALHQGLVEAMLGVVGTMFSVLLGLLVAGAIDNYRDVRTQVAGEGNALANVFRMARGLDEVQRLRLRNLCRRYNDVLLLEEWPEMKEHQKTSQKAWDLYTELWEAAVAVESTDNRTSNLHQCILASMQVLGENRRQRAVTCTGTLTPVLWGAITIGALITIGFTYLFTSKFGALHVLLTSLIAASLGLNIWLLAAYSSPFSGDLCIEPQIFELLKTQVFTTPDTPSRYLLSPAGTAK